MTTRERKKQHFRAISRVHGIFFELQLRQKNIDSAFAKCALRGPAAVDPVQTDAIRGKVCPHYISVCLCVAAAAAPITAGEQFGSMSSVYGNDAKIVVVVN